VRHLLDAHVDRDMTGRRQVSAEGANRGLVAQLLQHGRDAVRGTRDAARTRAPRHAADNSTIRPWISAGIRSSSVDELSTQFTPFLFEAVTFSEIDEDTEHPQRFSVSPRLALAHYPSFDVVVADDTKLRFVRPCSIHRGSHDL
jgi:hypothetical protein